MQQANEKDKFAAERQAMVRVQLKKRDITDPAVLRVMADVPREKFIPAECLDGAYFDGPLPIGCGQTISQPYIVALMTQELKVDKNSEVLEIGTGSGYQTAILAKLAKEVYTIERIEHLALNAQRILAEMNITNVKFHTGDGTIGWPFDSFDFTQDKSAQGRPEQRQFDRIIITAATPQMPKPLLEQLKTGGIAVVPLGADYVQELVVIEKTVDGLKTKSVCGCRFVKLIGKFGYSE
ncbi:MAG: protein-L-isoaspartate O-methyltransferase [Phycisphaerae bacterium]|nr:protein-L-isoaspartate O-methyltransferase [Phycisphaerae bacterium]